MLQMDLKCIIIEIVSLHEGWNKLWVSKQNYLEVN